MLTIYPSTFSQPRCFPSATGPTVSVVAGGTLYGVGAVFIGTGKTISKIGVMIDNSAGGAATSLRASIRTVSAGLPTTTIVGSGTAKGDAVPTTPEGTQGWFEWTLDTPFVAVANTTYAAVITDEGAGDGWSVGKIVTAGVSSGLPYAVGANGAGTWSITNTGLPCVTPLYGDGSYENWAMGILSCVNDATWNSGTTSTLYKGCRFVPTMDRRVIGFDLFIRPATGSTFDALLLDGSNSILATATLNPALNWSAVNAMLRGFLPIPATQVTSGSTYRAVLKPTSGTNPTTWLSTKFGNAALKQNIFGELSSTVGSSAFSWTDSATSGFFNIVPVFDQVSSGGGGIMGNSSLEGM